MYVIYSYQIIATKTPVQLIVVPILHDACHAEPVIS